MDSNDFPVAAHGEHWLPLSEVRELLGMSESRLLALLRGSRPPAPTPLGRGVMVASSDLARLRRILADELAGILRKHPDYLGRILASGPFLEAYDAQRQTTHPRSPDPA